jgi:DNA-binding response OmpR family regulator
MSVNSDIKEEIMKKVLVVDDDKNTRLALKKIIESMGFAVIQSPEGGHAYETLLNDDSISLVVADMVMPKHDGRWLIKNIQANEDLKEIPIIIISAVFGVKDIADLLECGAKAFVAKPANPDELQEYVKRYIG